MTIGLTLSVNGSQVRALPPIPFTPGMNAQNALEAAYVPPPSGTFSFVLQYFGSFGYEVIEIDGIAAQTGVDASLYWEFFYNGVSSPVGIDATFLNDGDQLNFSYTTYVASQHAKSRLGDIHRARGGQ